MTELVRDEAIKLFGERALAIGLGAICLLTYIAGVTGFALTVGGWLAWVAVTAAGGAPGLFLLRKYVERMEIDRAIRRTAPAAPRPTGAAVPDALGTPGEVPPAF